MASRPRPGALLLLAAVIGGPCTGLFAQTVLMVEGSGPTVLVTAGPPGGACAYPNGPVIDSWPANVPFGCTTAGSFLPPPGLTGDVAVDKIQDLVWVTDGVAFTAYDRDGIPVSSFRVPPGTVLPGPVTGLGFVDLSGELWLTDGSNAAAILPPPAPACGLSAVVTVPSFPLFLGPGGVATDIDYESNGMTLLTVDTAGYLASTDPGGASAKWPPVQVAPGACGLSNFLTGIAVDDAATIVAYVTDGSTVARIDIPGWTPSSPTFYSPSSCFPVTSPPVSGLDQSLRPIPFGTGFDPQGGPPPIIDTIGQTIGFPWPYPFKMTLEAAAPNGLASLVAGTSAACPSGTVVGNPLYVVPLVVAGPYPVDASGSVSVPMIGPNCYGCAYGLSLFFQWFVLKPGGAVVQSTSGLVVTLGGASG